MDLFALQKANFDLVNAVGLFSIELCKPKVALGSLQAIVALDGLHKCDVKTVALLALSKFAKVTQHTAANGQKSHGHSHESTLVGHQSDLLLIEKLRSLLICGLAQLSQVRDQLRSLCLIEELYQGALAQQK